MAAPTQTKDLITCHVLDQTRGQPARGMRVRLELTPSTSSFAPNSSSSSTSNINNNNADAPTATLHHHHHPSAPAKTFESQTDDDGRVKTWLPYSADNDSGEVPVYTLDDVLGELAAAGKSRWTLRFDTGSYFGAGNTFFPEVAVVFEVQPGQNYHVPLLLSPYGYSTYRGS
ncbi:hypothetical protein MCOR27_004457 [Pyricularia oryzae]|uniref:Transthyretin/hydroxyisourate hydrolase domain-containing protein n=5 Tax=Pyricularia TaxID=48558 RepID=A0ABQ8NEZ0_PYRGI|nr:hydroxyisourate hydrolase [Pyricularia oryzae 70-15]ELQ38223.1 hypothetical protein OOU_Y34scaffold00548g39 [Pyricularia oryzae Y34]KAH8847616.1 hypothetical protein MCOR01_001030 [Pyricularia oryzae]KAI6295972.1 hypothetical protein MCOR33_007271 [Pyricularia grisea]EHA52399.1 hydroxyisourate hydrolase [Pyricularia oryzae 70-15]KAH9430454.1 hypothetical protein MCOR02_010155 [Pyricularia oryzae]